MVSYRKEIGILIPFLFFQITWWCLAIRHDYFSHFAGANPGELGKQDRQAFQPHMLRTQYFKRHLDQCCYLGSKHSCQVGLKSKVHVAQNWPNLEKRPPFLQFSSKLSDFFFVKDLTNRVLFPLFISFWEHTFFCQDATSEKWMTSISTPKL